MTNLPFPQNWRLYAPFALFFLVAVGRWLIWPTPSYDESEQLLHLQALSMGYGPQPPAFEWVYGAVNWVLPGDAYLKLLLLKAVCLAALYVGLVRFALRAIGEQYAIVAALLCLACPQIVWESQRSLTHSLLLMTVLVLLTSELLRLQDESVGRESRQDERQSLLAPTSQNQIKRAFVLGSLLAGLILSKYSGPVVFLTMLIALWASRLISPILIVRRWWKALLLALGMAALFVFPHAMWAWSSVQGPAEAVLSKITAQTASDPTWMGFRTLAGGLVSVLSLPIFLGLVASFLSRRPRPSETHAAAGYRTPIVPRKAAAVQVFALAQLFLTVVVGISLVLVADVSYVKDRWLVTFLVLVPMALVAGMASQSRPLFKYWLERLAAVALVVSSVVLVFRGPIEASQKKVSWETFDAAAFKSQTAAVLGKADVIVTDTMQLAGQLRLLFPEIRVVLLSFASETQLDEMKGLCGQVSLIHRQVSTPAKFGEQVDRSEQIRLAYRGSTHVTDYRMHTYSVDCINSQPIRR